MGQEKEIWQKSSSVTGKKFQSDRSWTGKISSWTEKKTVRLTKETPVLLKKKSQLDGKNNSINVVEFLVIVTLLIVDIPRMAMYSSKDFVVPAKLSEQFMKDFGNPDSANHFAYDGKTDDQLKRLHEVNLLLPMI